MKPLSRGRAFLRFIAAAVWAAVAYFLAERAAHALGPGAVFPLIRDLFAIFLLILGYSYMDLIWDNGRHPIRAVGLGTRRGAAREFGLGAALGWGMVVVVFLVVVGVGQYYVRITNTPHAWTLLVLHVFTLAAGSLAVEIVFRGYPFQKLVQATSPFAATVLAGLFFGLFWMDTVETPTTARWIYGVAAMLLSVGYLRTRGLWLPWGLHFTWLAGAAILFGQPLAGNRGASSVIRSYADGPSWLTGGEYGPAASVVTLIVLWIGLPVLFLITKDLARKFSQPEPEFRGFSVDFGPAPDSAPDSARHRSQHIPGPRLDAGPNAGPKPDSSPAPAELSPTSVPANEDPAPPNSPETPVEETRPDSPGEPPESARER